jgi:uncharacterized protein YbjT (DUF2867 family)
MTNSDVPTILITGGSGTVGGELAKQLTSAGVEFRAMVRSTKGSKKAAALKGVDTVPGDFDDPGSLGRALRGVERAFLLTNSSDRAEAQQTAFVGAAKQAGVKHIVKLSQWAASSDSPVRFLRYHGTVERRIRESGVAFTFLRPNLFMQGLLAFKDTIASQGKFFAAIGDARISAVDVRDIAAAAAAALTANSHEGKTYNLTGPQALTHAEIAAQLSSAMGREIRFVDVPPDAMRQALLGVGLLPWQAEGLVEDYAHYSRGEGTEVTTGIFDATGKQPRSFETFAKDYAGAFATAGHKKAGT